jgi:hypothetical protein
MSKNSISPAELYSIHFQNPQPSHFAMVPHIIDHLTYNVIDENGKETKKRLSVHAKELYRVLMRIAGEEGACWMNRDNLAEICNMSAGSVSNAKKELTQNFNEFDGKPLIILHQCKKNKIENDIKKNSTIYHKITLTDIWRYNRAYMMTKKFVPEKRALSPHDGAGQALSPHDGASQGALSPHDTIDNPINKNPLFKEQQPAVEAPAPVCSLNSQDIFVDPPDMTPAIELKRKAFNWFMQIGCDEKSALEFVQNYSIDDIKKASAYVEMQMKKKKEQRKHMTNVIGYLRQTLEKRWWETKKTE